MDDDCGAAFGEQPCVGATEPPACAGHERDLTAEIDHGSATLTHATRVLRQRIVVEHPQHRLLEAVSAEQCEQARIERPQAFAQEVHRRLVVDAAHLVLVADHWEVIEAPFLRLAPGRLRRHSGTKRMFVVEGRSSGRTPSRSSRVLGIVVGIGA